MTKQIVTCQTAEEVIATLNLGNAALLVQRCGLCGQRKGEEVHSMIDMRFRPLAEEDAAAASARAERAEQDLARLQATIAAVERDLATALRQWAGNTDIGRYASGWPLISESTDHEDIEARMYTEIVVRQRSRERQCHNAPETDQSPAPLAGEDRVRVITVPQQEHADEH